MNEKFQGILDDIKMSTKEVKVLPIDETVKKKVREKYSIHPESLLGILLENTGGINFMTRNQWMPLEIWIMIRE